MSKLARTVGHVSASVLTDKHLTKMVPGLSVTFEAVFVFVLCPAGLGIKFMATAPSMVLPSTLAFRLNDGS